MGGLVVAALTCIFLAEMLLQYRQFVFLRASQVVPPQLSHMLDAEGLHQQNHLAWAELRSRTYRVLYPFTARILLFGFGLTPWILWMATFVQGRLKLRLSQIGAPEVLISMALSDCVNSGLASVLFYLLNRLTLIHHSYERDSNVLQLHITKMEYLSEFTAESLRGAVLQSIVVGVTELAVSFLPQRPSIILCILIPLAYTLLHMLILKTRRMSPPPNSYPLMDCQLRDKLVDVARDLNFPNPTDIYVYHKGKPRIHVAGWTKKTQRIYIHNHLLTMHTHPEILLFVAHILAGRLFPINADTFPLAFLAISEYIQGLMILGLCWSTSFHAYMGLERWQPILLAVYIVPYLNYPVLRACEYASNYWKRSQTFQKDAGLVCLGNTHLSFYGYTLSSVYKRVSPLDGDPLWLSDTSGRPKLRERLNLIGWVPRERKCSEKYDDSW